MQEIRAGAGVCMGFGGTNARIADCFNGDIERFRVLPTPNKPDQFFAWVARNLLEASSRGKEWLVAGFPGLVSRDGSIVGPLNNVSGMREEEYDLKSQLASFDPAVERVMDDGFMLMAVNDGTLAAHAAASRIGDYAYSLTGVVIVGTGVGAGIVEKDQSLNNVYRSVRLPLEIGHSLLSSDPEDTIENRYSGTAIEKKYGNPKDLGPEHPVWVEEGQRIGRLALDLGLNFGADLVVPTGGVGAGASDKFRAHTDRFIEDVLARGNKPQRNLMPKVMYVPPNECDGFEMYGAEGVMRDFLSRRLPS